MACLYWLIGDLEVCLYIFYIIYVCVFIYINIIYITIIYIICVCGVCAYTCVRVWSGSLT